MLMQEFGAIVSYCFHTQFNPKIRASVPSNSCIQECMMDYSANR
jgi:hypothetical protein